MKTFLSFSLSCAALAFVALCSEASAAAGCDYSFWKKFDETRLYRHRDGSAYFFLSRRKHVTVAGAPHAYHKDDVGKPCGKASERKPKGDACPPAGFADGAWRRVVAEDPKRSGFPYVGPDGFYVSKTALTDPAKEPADSAAYVNPYRVPYVALPAGEFLKMKGTGAPGDYGMAWNLSNGRSSAFVVAEKSPSGSPLGTASPALYRALGGKGASAVKDRSGLPDGDVVLFAVFPGTRVAPSSAFPLAQEGISKRVKAKAEGLLDSAKSCVK